MISSAPISITGFGWTTPLGDDVDAVWRRLLAGETGLVEIPHTARLLNGLGAPVAPELLGEHLAAAGRDLKDPDVQLVLGTSLGAFLEGEPESAPLDAWADAIALAAGAARPPISLSTACSSGSDAILVGAELIRAGVATCCVCGGVDVLTLTKRLAHSALGSMSRTMLRAFDARHDGTLLGEGAGFVVLEALRPEPVGLDPSVRAPMAILRGVGSANDAAGMTTPDADALGARLAIERSLADAGLDPEAIGVINAHGSGTPLNDATEARAFRDVFGRGGARPIVFGTKGNFGHSLGATGVLEAITVLLALRTGQVPPIAALEQPYPEMDFPLPRGVPMALPLDARFGMSVTLGFGGFDTSLIFERIG